MDIYQVSGRNDNELAFSPVTGNDFDDIDVHDQGFPIDLSLELQSLTNSLESANHNRDGQGETTREQHLVAPNTSFKANEDEDMQQVHFDRSHFNVPTASIKPNGDAAGSQLIATKDTPGQIDTPGSSTESNRDTQASFSRQGKGRTKDKATKTKHQDTDEWEQTTVEPRVFDFLATPGF